MKQNKKILILCFCVLVLGGFYVILNQYETYQEKKEAKEEENQKVYVMKDAELCEITMKGAKDQIRFVKKDDTWTNSENDNIPISQTKVESLTAGYENMEAVQRIEKPDALEDYGLDHPTYEIELTEKNGEQTVLYFGNITGYNQYLMKKGEDEVYIVSSDISDGLDFDVSSYVQDDTTPSISSSNLKKVVVTKNGKTIFEDEKEEDMNQLAGGFGALVLSSPVSLDVSKEDETDYGLDEKNRLEITATYLETDDDEDSTKFVLFVGDEYEEGDGETTDTYRYVRVKGSDLVYGVDAETIRNMMTVSEEEK